ncbi:MAG TPA: PH domain-containing protein [Nocardioidaceae bacterium]|nr:PH domain-containing protein [Nocardioidaceae bacterium]
MTERPYRRLSPLTPVVRSFIVLVAAAWTIMRDITRGDIGPTALLFGLVLAGGAVYGVASWLRTKFWIEADELRVDTGVISRQSRRIRIDRLQGIDIVQPFVARIFGLAELRMDVAGGSSREGSLAFLPLGEARELKDLLLARRDAVRAGTSEEEPVAAAPAPVEPERVLARVDLTTLALSILLSVETLLILVTASGLLVTFAVTGRWLGASAMLPVLAGFGIVLVRRLTGNYRFTVSQTPSGLQVGRGLFDLNVQTIALARVQGVVVSEPLLWRTFGWARLDVSIAGYGSSAEDQGPAPSTVLPVGDRRLVLQLAQHVLGGPSPEALSLSPPPRRARWAAPVGWRFMAAGATENLVVSREGWLVRRTHAAPQARVQSLRLSQGPWQRRLGLADVHADSPPGPTLVRARHRPAEEARRVFETEVAVTRQARRSSRT